jgi:hypothetical protein
MPRISDTFGSYDSDPLKQSVGELLGLAHGLMADQQLTDSEIAYFNEWLDKRHAITSSFPGNVIYERIREVLADGVITEEEREHLVETLNTLIEGRLEELKDEVELQEFWFDEVDLIDFQNTRFSLTGNFVYGSKAQCQAAIEQRGGIVGPVEGAEPQFLVVGGLGVEEWRSGGLGAEIEKALKLQHDGVSLKIIPEDKWVSLL